MHVEVILRHAVKQYVYSCSVEQVMMDFAKDQLVVKTSKPSPCQVIPYFTSF